MKQPQHIPTIAALVLLLVTMASVVFLVENTQQFFARAQNTQTPQQVTISNISDSAFTISWTTQVPTRGTVSYKSADTPARITLDDRDNIAPNSYTTHHVTINELAPATVYEVTILSNDTEYIDDIRPYRIQTAAILSTVAPAVSPIFGTISQSSGQPAAGALIYAGIDGVQLKSAIAEANGQFVLPLSPLYSNSLNQYARVGAETLVSLTMHTHTNRASAVATLKNTRPLPGVTMGKSYDFRALEPLGLLMQSLKTVFNKLNKLIATPVFATAAISITQPEPDAGIPSRLPQFRGTGVVGKQVIATTGTPPQTGKVWVGENNVWSWIPDQPLLPDTYVLTITTFDAADNPIALSRSYTILKSGTSVLQAATPSATPVVTPQPTATAAASPSAQPIPVSGNTSLTIAIAAAGLSFMLLGSATFARFYVRRKR